MRGVDVMRIYLNYLRSLETRKEHGKVYGDTDVVINHYEDMLEKEKVKVKTLGGKNLWKKNN